MPRDDWGEKAERIARDVEHAVNGNFDRISEATQRDAAEFVRDHMEGRTRVEVDINERVSIEGRRERDGTVSATLRFKIP